MTTLRAGVLGVMAALLSIGVAYPAAAAPLRFGTPIWVDRELAGGEPLVFADKAHHTLIYTSHEGTTHLYQPGLVSGATLEFGLNYRNQVNLWTSSDNGSTWTRVNYLGGFVSPPVANSGFSDPDLTQDAGGRIYDTGIDLVNDALFSTTDGGRSCPVNGIPDSGDDSTGHHYDGNGKLLYDRGRDALAEPITYDDGLGVSTWRRGDAAFTPHRVYTGSTYAHWPMLVQDSAGTLYLVWDTDPRQAGTTGGCDGDETPAPNRVVMSYSKDFGQTWSSPRTVAAPSSSRAFWPWAVAGDAGKVSVVWYQTDQLVDLACQKAKLNVKEATITSASSGSPKSQTVDVVGRPIADNNICQNGTTCVATGEDRRLGDFFTNAVDERGCVLVATADTTQPDPLTGGERSTSLPLFVRQVSGPRLVGKGDCST